MMCKCVLKALAVEYAVTRSLEVSHGKTSAVEAGVTRERTQNLFWRDIWKRTLVRPLVRQNPARGDP